MSKYAQGFKELFGRKAKEHTILNAIGTEIRVNKNARKGDIFTIEQGCMTLRNDLLVKALLLRPAGD